VAAPDRPGRQLLRPAGDARISMRDARDVAAVTARPLLEDGHAEACERLGADLGWYLARLNQSHAGNPV